MNNYPNSVVYKEKRKPILQKVRTGSKAFKIPDRSYFELYFYYLQCVLWKEIFCLNPSNIPDREIISQENLSPLFSKKEAKYSKKQAGSVIPLWNFLSNNEKAEIVGYVPHKTEAQKFVPSLQHALTNFIAHLSRYNEN